MPIQSFNSVTDGLDSGSRSRGHFIANLDTEDEQLWVSYADGVWLQPCCFNVTSGGFSVLLKGLPGAQLGVHYCLQLSVVTIRRLLAACCYTP
jgi:hypothetical protein